jgi:hypothetical protein
MSCPGNFGCQFSAKIRQRYFGAGRKMAIEIGAN